MKKTFHAKLRTVVGKGASRRLRHANLIPAVIYGVGHEPLSVELSHDDVFHAQEDAKFYTTTLTVKIDSLPIKVRVQDMQRHVFKPKLVHVDFKRV